jgi:DNA invertase Pin-like site-specific DNA recombinase
MDKEKLRALFTQKPELAKKILQVAQQKGYLKGGRVGYADGSQPQITQQQVAMIVTMLKKGADMSTISSMVGIPEQQVQMIVSKIQQGIQQKAKGGITEIDYRDKGGFVPPIGKKERADDIPAMLSNNEFVFTANAVRNAGGGSVKKGAKKMYALMKKLEGK